MLVSKSSIQKELGRRFAEFAPPGEQLRGVFEAEYGETPFLNPTGNPIFLLLTSNYVLFVGAKRYSNNPTRTLGTVPRGAMRFQPPDNGVAHFRVNAQMHDDQGQWYQVRLKIHKMWREEATAFIAAVSAPAPQAPRQPPQQPPQYPQAQQPYPPQQYPAQGQQPYPPAQGQYPQQPYPPYQQPYPPQPQQPPYPPQQGQGRS